jgi:ferredoxin
MEVFMIQFKVDQDLCTKCGLCVSDCVTRIISKEENGFPFIPEEKEENCLECQHCLAVCPAGAVSIFGKEASDSIPLTDDSFPGFDKVVNLVRGRRSVRHYKNENVDPDLLNEIFAALANSPTGVNAMELTYNVIDDKDVMHRFKEQVMDLFVEADKSGKLEKLSPRFHQMAIMPRDILSANLFRNAHHALIVSAAPDAPCPREDIALTLAYFEVLAQSAGLGTVWWGYLSAMTSVLPEIKTILGIPEDHLFYSMLFGIPSIKFARTVQRDTGAVVRRIRL